MKFRNVALASTAAVIAAVAIGSGAAQATSLITGHDVKDGSIHKVDLGNGINHRLDRKLPGKDGVTDLNAGANYSTTWVGDNGASLQTVISKCDDGQVAVGGGFSTWGGTDTNESDLPYDLGGDNKNIQVTVSAPYTGKAYDESKYHGGILPDRWVVKGYNNGGTDQIVRAWVICANAS